MMTREAKKLAEQMLDTYGEGVFEDRQRVIEWLLDHGLDADEQDAIEFERYARWLWE